MSVIVTHKKTEQLMKDWTSSIYACFAPVPEITYSEGRHSHVFKCLGKSCRASMWRFLDTGDKGSTTNMWKHARKCWGKDFVNTIDEAASLEVAHDISKKFTLNGTITTVFEQKKVTTYTSKPHTKAGTR